SVIAVRELLGNTNVLSVAVAPDGRVWLGTMDGAARREPDGTWTILGLPGTISRGFGWGSITAIAFDKDGNAWLGTGKGLLRVDTGGAWRQYEENDHRAVHDVAVDLDGNAWIARSVRDLIRVSPDAPMSGSAGRLTLTKADGLPSQFVSAIDFDQEGRLWVAWYDGIAVRNPDGTWTTWKGELGFTLPSRAVSGLDASGDEPVAAAWGMALRRDRDHASGTWTSFEPSSSLGASQAVSGIIVLPDGEVAAGIEAGGGPGGLAIRDNAGLWRLYPLSDATPGAIGSNDFGPRDIVPVMEPTNAAWDGSLWLVGNDNLYRWRSAIDGRPGRLERDVKPPDHDCLFPSHLAAPSLGSLWLACGSGDGQVSPSMWQRGTGIDAKWTAVALPEGREIFDLAVGPGAVVWAAAYDAAYRMTSDGWQRVTAILDGNDLFIWQIAFDRRGDAWLLEGVEGHVVVQPASGPPRTIHLLPNDWAQTLAPDPAGGMWVGTDAGVAFVDPAGVVTTANVPDPPSTPAGQSTNWNQVRSLAIGLRGELWVGTPMGVARWR
ncbi:MAG: two-component regulator propeller domain-containing protein, partial [Ardenticatenales bacterium]